MKEGFPFVANDTPSRAMIMSDRDAIPLHFPNHYGDDATVCAHGAWDSGADKSRLLMGASAIGSLVGSIFLIGLPRENACR